MDKSIGRMITLVSRRSQFYAGNILKKYDLSVAEQPFFMTLQSCDGITQEELTALVCVDKALTARAVKSLEEKGLLVRAQDEKDRRQKRLYLTDKARRLAPKVKEELLKCSRQMTEGIDEACLELFYEALLKIEENLKHMQAERKEQSDGEEQ